MVDLEPLIDAEDVDFVQVAIMKHVTYTGSRHAERLLADWAALQKRIVKVMPREYKRALAEQAKRAKETEATTVVTTLNLAGVAAAAAVEDGALVKADAGTPVHG
jgi:glutamate synthase domain-containing protein 3